MSRNTSLATVGGMLLVSALQGMEDNNVRSVHRDFMRRVDRSLGRARHQAANASMAATLLVGVALLAYVANDHRRVAARTRRDNAAGQPPEPLELSAPTSG